jgi:hypothetical protein
METYAVCLLPRREFVERHLRRAEAERYVEIFNRVMRLGGVRAEMVPERVEVSQDIIEADESWGVA